MLTAEDQTTRSTRLGIDFDAASDVLYISFGRPSASHTDEAAHGLLLRWTDTDDQPSGVTATEFGAYWRDHLTNFCLAVSGHLGVPEELVRCEINRTLRSAPRRPAIRER